MRSGAVRQYLEEYLREQVTVKSVPELLINHQVRSMLNYYSQMAASYVMSLADVVTMENFADINEFIAAYREENLAEARFSLALQAAAESAEISVSNDDLAEYFAEVVGVSDYSEYEAHYGLPYLKQAVLFHKTIEMIIENAVLS
jgi:FKBP-type peptidyl-prolyl cis-trans isomerase (trigger factor)